MHRNLDRQPSSELSCPAFSCLFGEKLSLLCFGMHALLTRRMAVVCVCRQVGDSISCFVMDVEDGTPLLTQRLAEDADDELAEFAGGRPCWKLAGISQLGCCRRCCAVQLINRSASHVHPWCFARTLRMW
jgi:hypothetical protein